MPQSQSQWDIFHSGRLEVQRGLSTEEVRAALRTGEILEDDLARPAGSTTPWTRLAELPELSAPESVQESEPKEPLEPEADADADADVPLPADEAPTSLPPSDQDALEAEIVDEDEADGFPPSSAEAPLEAEIVDEEEDDFPASDFEVPMDAEVDDDPTPRAGVSTFKDEIEPEAESAEAEPVLAEVAEDEKFAGESRTLPEYVDPLEEDEAIAEFSLASTPGEKTEPIDLTAMVDVAFQLVLFFLVTATTIYFKTLEIPEPSPDDQDSVAQELRTLDDLLEEYILVEIDTQGSVLVDREPIEAAELVSRMRQAREDTLRTAMLLMADFSTPHANAVRAYDAANELGLGIAIAKPTAPANGG